MCIRDRCCAAGGLCGRTAAAACAGVRCLRGGAGLAAVSYTHLLTNPESSNELDTLTSQYLDHAIDLDTYIREMDQRVRMMMLEDM